MKASRYFTGTLLFPAALFFLLAIGCGQSVQKEQAQGLQDSPGWRVIGPGGGGGIFLPTISPHDANLVLAHCDMTAAYITYDGGDNWRMFNLWTVPEDFEFDPNEPNTIYAATRGYLHSEDRGSGLSCLFRSEDRGRRWRIIYPAVEKARQIEGKYQAQNLLPGKLIEGAFDGSITAIRVVPAESRHIYLGLAPMIAYMGGNGQPSMKSAIVIHSTDRGESWSFLAEVPGFNVLGIFPGGPEGNSGEITVFTESACVRIDHSSGKATGLPLPAERIIAAGGGTGQRGTILYVLSPMERSGGKLGGGMFRSSDRGASWVQINNGLLQGVSEGEVPGARSFGVCEKRPEVVYISTRNARAAREIEDSWLFGIFKTENAGESWKPVWLANGDGYLTENHKGSWLERQWGPGWGGNPIDLGVAPADPDICFGTDAGRAYRTRDGGRNWEQIHSHNQPDGSVTSSGLDVTTCYGVHFDPFDPNHFFISYTDIGLFHTLDRGKTWFHSVKGAPRSWTNTCYWMEFDPEVKGRAWSVWGNAHDLPRDKMFSPRGFGRYQGGVAFTDDSGLTWRKSNAGMPENSVCTNVLVDPRSPKDSRTLYVTAYDRGVYKSVDSGASWEEANSGLGANRFAWQIRCSSTGRLILLLSRGHRIEGNRRERKITTVPGELFTSEDRAASWQPLPLPEGINAPHDIQIDPAEPKRMYLSCWAQSEHGRDVKGGLYRTQDGGKTWKLVFDQVRRVNSAALDPRNPDTIYINTFHNAAFRSDDRGETWRRLEGYRFKWGQRAIPDANDPGMLFLTTYGGSVHYGPAGGVPGAFEDIENVPESWW